MTPKEKANELFMKFIMDTHTDLLEYGIDKDLAIQCACICVDEIILSFTKLDFEMIKSTNYWIDVKIELNNLSQ